MDFAIEFAFDPSNLNKLTTAVLDGKVVDLIYWHGLGTARIRCGPSAIQIDLSLVYFATELIRISNELSSGRSESSIEDTESDGSITFTRQNNEIRINSDFSPRGCTTTLSELRAAAGEFAKNVIDEIRRRVPKLTEVTDYVEAKKKVDAFVP